MKADRAINLMQAWIAEGLGWEDIEVLLKRRGYRMPKEQVRQWVLRTNKAWRQTA